MPNASPKDGRPAATPGVGSSGVTDSGVGTSSEERIESLVRRLAEAEAMLEAVVSGQVDAVADPLTAAPILLRDAQEALRRSEARYRDLVARSPAIVCELSPDGTTTFVNEAITPILGYQPADLVGKNWWDTLCPASERGRVDTLYERFREGDVTDYELVLIGRDGSSRTVVWNSANRYATDGTLESVVAFGLDITARKRAEESAQRLAVEQAARAEAEAAEQRAARLAEASRVLASSLDYETTLASVASLVVPTLGDWCAVDIVAEDGTIRRLAVRHADPKQVRWAAELERRYPSDPAAEMGIAKVIRSGQSGFYPDVTDEMLVASARDAEHLAVLRSVGIRSVLIVPLTARGRTFGAITLISAGSSRRYEESDLHLAEDLAHRAAVAVENARLYQEASAARAEAEAANKAKSEFLAVMSHELRTPLNAIAGYANLLEEGVQGPLNDKQREYVRRVQSNEAHLLGLINDVLNFAKLEAGRVQFEVEDVSLSMVLTEVDDLIAPQVVAKGVRYENRRCGEDVVVRADHEKLRQVILNLLSNAVKFTASGGEIVIECRTAGEYSNVMVRDTGIGIAADKLEAIFEPFVQLGKTPNREGTGLGLAISRDLARAMGGELTATSVPGEGSVFTLSLPLATGGAGGSRQS